MANTTISTLPQNAGAASPASARRLAIWLLFMCVIIAAMVVVGGATRLTDSGLSITEWRPVTGAVPPMNDAAWAEEFEKYKTIPEYSQVNYGMSLGQFKSIYWWEWGHRFLGRIIGLVFLFPLIGFVVTRQVRKPLALKLFGLFLLGGMQGALGWWMVSSGLSARVDVSQYRLAAHLALAVALYAAMFWLAVDLWPRQMRDDAPSKLPKYLPVISMVLTGGIFIQMILGAFVAGLRAGRTFNTWPLMGGKFFPDGYFSAPPGWQDLFETMAAVQFNHRIGAYLLALGAAWFYLAARKTVFESRARLVLAAVGLQIVLGIWTLLAVTPISLGLLHQLGALGVLSAALYAMHGIMRAAHSGAI